MKLNNEGFTLLELLVALAISTMVLMAFTTTINTSIRGNTKNDKDIKALNIAQTEIENIRVQIKEGKHLFENSNGDSVQVDRANGNIFNQIVDGKNFEVIMFLTKETTSSLYTLKVVVKATGAGIDDYFSKKETEIITQIYGV